MPISGQRAMMHFNSTSPIFKKSKSMHKTNWYLQHKCPITFQNACSAGQNYNHITDAVLTK